MQLLDAFVERLFGDLHQPLRFLADLADADGDRRIAVESLVNHPVIEADNIALAQRPIGRDAMNDFFIHRRAQTTRIDPASNVIAFKRRNRISLERHLLGDGIQIKRGDTGRDSPF